MRHLSRRGSKRRGPALGARGESFASLLHGFGARVRVYKFSS